MFLSTISIVATAAPVVALPLFVHLVQLDALFRREHLADMEELERPHLVQVASNRLHAIDLEVGHTMRRCYRSRPDDPLAARSEVADEITLRRGEWSVRVATETSLTATGATFELAGKLEAHAGEALVLSRRWHRRIPRHGV